MMAPEQGLPPQGAPPGGGGITPELLALLAGGGGMPDAGGGSPITPESGGTGSDDEYAGLSGSDKLRKIIEWCRQYIAEENDEANKLGVEKVTTELQKILANEEKDQDQLLGNRALRRTVA